MVVLDSQVTSKPKKSIFFQSNYVLRLPIPPSSCKTLPVIQLLSGPSRNPAACAISLALPILPNGCLSFAFSILDSLFRNFEARGVFTIDGAIAFTLILGANSAASERVSPSKAPFEAATELWKGIPVCTATVLKNTTDALPLALNLDKTAFN